MCLSGGGVVWRVSVTCVVGRLVWTALWTGLRRGLAVLSHGGELHPTCAACWRWLGARTAGSWLRRWAMRRRTGCRSS